MQFVIIRRDQFYVILRVLCHWIFQYSLWLILTSSFVFCSICHYRVWSVWHQPLCSVSLVSTVYGEFWRYPSLFCAICHYLPWSVPRSGELRTQKLKSHLVRTQSLNVLSLKPGEGQYMAIHATLTSRDFFLAYFYPSGPFTCIFPKPLPIFFLCWLWLTHGSCVGPQNKICHPAGCRFLCWMLAEYK